MKIYLRKLICLFKKNEESIIISGGLNHGVFYVPGNISSQFISGLLFALPLAKGDSKIVLTSPLESKQYVDMTIEMLSKFQIQIIEKDNEYFVKGNQIYRSQNIMIEGDYSQLAFFGVLGQISDRIECKNIPFESKQPDRKILDYILKMGGSIEFLKKSIVFSKSKTKGAVLDMSQCPDIAPILGILAALSEGETKLVNAARLAMKESNRLVSTYETLTKLGVDATLGEDSLSIRGVPYFQGGTFESYHDHRIVMSIAIASCKASGDITIRNADAINKSYPNFFKDLEKLGADITYIEE